MAKNKNKRKKTQPQKQQEFSPEKYILTKARSLPIVECLIDADWNKIGVTYVIIARQHTTGKYTAGFYLVDTFCRGVKDTFFRFNIEEYEYQDLKEGITSQMTSTINVSYNEIHNLIYGAIAYAEDFGMEAHPDFKLTQYLLEEDTDDIPLIEYEFGKDGKPFLVARSNFEAANYKPILQKHAGDDFGMVIRELDNSFLFDDDYDENDDENDEYDDDEYMPEVVYSYQHPTYPLGLSLNHPEEMQNFFENDYNHYLPKECIDKILALPRETLIADLKHIILFEIGRTYEKIDDDSLEEDCVAALCHSLFFIAELKAEECLDEVLEILRQSYAFSDFYFADRSEEILLPALYETGRNNLQKLADFIQEPGLSTLNKGHVYAVVQQIAYHEPERRDEVIEWFRNQLNLCIAQGHDLIWYDGILGGKLCNALKDMHAKELLPKIELLCDTCDIDAFICGDYAETEDAILFDDYTDVIIDRIDIYERYK